MEKINKNLQNIFVLINKRQKRKIKRIKVVIEGLLILIFLFNPTLLNAQPIADSWRLPLDGEWFAPNYQGFGYKNIDWNGYHLGEDIWRSGGTPVYAAANGRVYFSGLTTDATLGAVVVIEHKLPDGSYVCSVYWHLKESGLISNNVDVSKGQIIGYVADIKTYPGVGVEHLHFGIRSGKYSTTPDPDGKWRYRGYATNFNKDIVDLWYSPSHFITDTLILDDYTPFFERQGSYWWGKYVGYNWHTWWTYADDTLNPVCWGRWNLNSIRNYAEGRFKAGQYEVFAFIPSDGANSKKAKYEIKHNGKISQFIIDQSIYSNVWVSLGTYDLVAY